MLKQGVLFVVAHLVITLAILGVYAYSLFTGHPDQTSQNLLVAIVGYWFGAIGFDKITNSKNGSPSDPGQTGGGKNNG